MSRTPRTDRPDLLPEARDAEAMLIGAILVDPSMLDACVRIVAADDFERPMYRVAWAAAVKRREAGEPVDYALIAADVEAQTNDAGAAVALTDSMLACPMAMHAPAYAKMVYAASARRGILGGAADVASMAHEATDDVDGLMAFTLRRFEDLDRRTAYQESGDFSAALQGLTERGIVRGFDTGIPCYDEWTPGLRPREVHTIAGYTGTGKTFALCQMANALIDQGATVAIFSVEMPVEALVPRLLANRAGSAAMKLGREGATFSDGEYDRLMAGVQRLAEVSGDRLSIYHEQTSLAQIAAVVRQRRPDVAFVDYVQLLDPPAQRMTEYEAITANSVGIQKLAQRAACCMVVLSQVNEENQRSAGADRALGLKGSGAIGAVSDVVIRLSAGEDGTITISARKARHGPDINSGARAEYRMDKATGKLMPKLAVVTPPAGFIDRAAGGESW